MPLIRKSVESLGFNFSDIKILLISHAHYDHCAGSAANHPPHRRQVLRHGARCLRRRVRRQSRLPIRRAKSSCTFRPRTSIASSTTASTVSLGGTVLTAHLTAGHTKGTTTWTLDETENGRILHVVIVGSPNVNPGYKLVGNKVYPQIAADYKRGFAVLNNLPCDIFLGAHGGYFDLDRKISALEGRRQERLHRSRRLQGLHRRREQAFQKRTRTGKSAAKK